MAPATHPIARRVLAWYDRHARTLPWRAKPGERADPYRVWLSEIMLQQTTVAAVGPYFARFLERWPDVAALAAAPLEDVLAAWAGLGYYARARNLHACARAVAATGFPDTEAALRDLPGIGAYTAAAIAAIAFGRHATPVDGNIERVIARLHAVPEALPRAKPKLRALAAALTPPRAGDFAQALMDLGATICVPRKPRCVLCPIRDDCAARAEGRPEDYPRKAPKRARPLRHADLMFVTRADGTLWLRRRPSAGLLGGMLELPAAAWREGPWRESPVDAPAGVTLTSLPGLARHGFTHFEFEMKLHAGVARRKLPGEWWPIEKLGEAALPSVMRKAIAHALKALSSAPPARADAARPTARAGRRG